MFSLIAQMEKENIEGNDERLFYRHSTKLMVKDVYFQEDQNSNIIFQTSSVIENFSCFSDNWYSYYFTLKIDFSEPEGQERLEDLGYDEFKTKGITVFDFIKIKSVGRKLYMFTPVDSRLEIKCVKRKMDLSDYDDVNRIYLYYLGKTWKYENMERDIINFEKFIELDRDTYESDKEKLEKWKNFKTTHLDEMSSDDDVIVSDNDQIGE